MLKGRVLVSCDPGDRLVEPGAEDGAASDLAVGASHTGSEGLGNSASTVADTERRGADADKSTVGGARGAAGRRRSSSGGGGGAASGLGGSGGRGGSRAGSGSEDGTRVGGLGHGGRLEGSGLRGSGVRVVRAAGGSSSAASGSSGSTKLAGTSTELGLSSATGTLDLEAGNSLRALGHSLAGVGVEGILLSEELALGGGQVDDEHVGKATESLGDIGARATGDLERSTVHVELAVAELVVP